MTLMFYLIHIIASVMINRILWLKHSACTIPGTRWRTRVVRGKDKFPAVTPRLQLEHPRRTKLCYLIKKKFKLCSSSCILVYVSTAWKDSIFVPLSFVCVSIQEQELSFVCWNDNRPIHYAPLHKRESMKHNSACFLFHILSTFHQHRQNIYMFIGSLFLP